MSGFFIYLAVIVSGASVLAVEILGTRILAPYYGAGLYLWSALISVTLAALSVGYAVGGRWADRGPKLERFCAILGLAGIWIAIVPWLRSPIFGLAEMMGLRVGVLVTATLLFFPPLALLGMVSPYAIRMKAASLDVVGRTAGNLYALSTVASVVAAVATGFLLIPNVGVQRLTLLIGVLLVVTALIGLASRHKVKAAVAVLSLAAFSVVLIRQLNPAAQIQTDSRLLAAHQSAYADLRVVELDSTRYMLIDGGTHTAADPATWTSQFPYANVLELVKGMYNRTGDMLLVGLGGGSIVKSFSRDNWRVEAVEIDPEVTMLARQYFGLQENEAHVHNMDGRQFLMSTDKTYDLIVMDAFGSSSIPFHLVTEEALGLLRARLVADGVVAMNIESVGWHDVIVTSLAATASRHFAYVTVLPIIEPPDQFGNIVLLAANRPLVLKQEPPVPLDRFSPEYDRAHAWDNRFIPDTTGAVVLTDDLNPIDVWSERVNLASRQQLHEMWQESGIAW